MYKHLILLVLLCPVLLFGQSQPPSAYQPQLITYGGTPFGPCQTYQFAQNVTTGSYYNCVGGAWSLVGGANNPAPQYGAAYYAGPGATNIIAGTSAGLTGQSLVFTNVSPPSPQSPGIAASINSPVSSTPYPIACDSGTAIVDRAHTLHFVAGASVITVPLSTASGCRGGFTTIIYNDQTSGSLTVNRSSPDTFTVYTAPGIAPLTGQTSFTLQFGQWATLNQDATGVWTARLSGGTGGGGTSGGNPSSAYTFSSTPITTAPFQGNLLVATATENVGNKCYTAGAGWTLGLNGCSAGVLTIGMEYQTAGSATSYTGNFTLAASATWSSTILAFSTTGTPALIQAKQATANTLAYTSNNTAGDLLIAVIRYNTGADGGPVTGVTCNSNTWKFAGLRAAEAATLGAGNTNFEEVWYAANANSGACTVTPAGVSGGATEIAIAEFSNVATSSPLVDYAYNPDSTGNTASTTISGATTNTQYLIQAVNNTTGNVDFSGRDSGAIFRSAANARSTTGGLFFFKNGVYPGQTSVQESIASQTNWYIWGLPGPSSATTEVSWHIVCESFSQFLYSNEQINGCIHQIMPSAYSGPAPSGAVLSGFWQRPSATFGAVGNDADFFVNNTVRLPDNQRSPSYSYDTFTSVYSSHDGSIADLVIPAGGQLCQGLTPAVTGVIGFRTNQTNTDETYFNNTWTVGMDGGYLVGSNHPIMNNAHASCGNYPAQFALTNTSSYGGELHHFQDIHNIAGMKFNCTVPGARFDSYTMVIEPALSGSFNRTTGATETTNGNCVGHIDTNTNGANGAALAPASFFAAGSGKNFRVSESDRLILPGLVTSNFTSAATTGTSKQTLASYTFPINSTTYANAGPFLNNIGAVYRIKAWGITAANGDSKTFEIDFGGTAIATITSTVNNGSIVCESELIVTSSANTQEVIGTCDDGTTHTVTRTAPGITANGTIVTNIAATTGTSSGDFTFKGLTVEYIGGQ